MNLFYNEYRTPMRHTKVVVVSDLYLSVYNLISYVEYKTFRGVLVQAR